jgi:Ca-activated chloride channel family protein
MNNQWELKTKISVARDHVFAFLDKASKYGELEFALRLFGHQFPSQVEDCIDTKLEVNFGVESIIKIKQMLTKTKPKGTAPIEASLARVENDFQDDMSVSRTLIFVVDGPDGCNSKICNTYQDIINSGRYEKVYFVGLGVSPDFIAGYSCITDFKNAVHEQDLKAIFDGIFNEIKPY